MSIRRIITPDMFKSVGIVYSNRHLRKLEAAGLWPKRVRLNGTPRGLWGYYEDEVAAQRERIGEARNAA